MANFKYLHTCSKCKYKHYSYFAKIRSCPNCGAKEMVVEDISYLHIDKFSEEGRKLWENGK